MFTVVLARWLTRRRDTKFHFFLVAQVPEQDVNVLKMWVLGHFHVLDVSSARMEMQKTSSEKKR